MGYDLRKGIPFPDGVFDAVYHSHVLEHFSKSEALPFLKECRRVLKPGGIIRVVVPDLERMARLYLESLQRSRQGEEAWQHNYEWIKLEMFDQAVREQEGGDMDAYLRRQTIPNEEFIIARIGPDGRRVIEESRQALAGGARRRKRRNRRRASLRRMARLVADRSVLREALIRRLLGEEYRLLELGRFRRMGEVHLWMYDEYALARILTEARFAMPRRVRADESRIPDWVRYGLDTEADGKVHKPDSLYMEGFKPRQEQGSGPLG